MNTTSKEVRLNNSITIPSVGLGVWRGREESEQMMRTAIQYGYRHIDTAKIYHNEQETGKAVRECGVNREELFVTTKIWVDAIREGSTIEAFDKSLETMRLEYIDLLLLHWPVSGYQKAYEDLEEIYKKSKAKAIGVSNCKIHHLKEIMVKADIIPAVNQIQYNPYFQPDETVSFCRENGIMVEAYSPLGHGDIFGDKTLQEIANKYGKTIAQVVLRWELQKGLVILPKSVHDKRIKENIQLFDFELKEEDCKLIDRLNRNERSCGVDPDDCEGLIQ